jgi:tetratricopeptide (TPR) repeat protein/transcriptional regulator with XRE-family HTH domain
MQQTTPYRNVVNPPIPIHFGAFLKMLRDRHGVTQAQVLRHLPFWDQSTYSRVEKDKIAPSYDQLPYIYEALHRAGVELTLQDRQQYLVLARRKIEAMRTRHEHKTASDWEKLRVTLAQIDHVPVETESQEHSRKPRVSGPRFAETRHLVGREEWLASLLASLQEPHPRKLVIVQGAPGMGKSSELNRLATSLLRKEFPRYKVLPCVLPAADRRLEPELALDELLGTLLVELGPRHESMPASFSLDERMLFVLGYVERAAGPLVVLIDNAENLFDEQGTLALCWEQFLTRFLRCQHQASLVLATSEWHGWFTGEKLFVTQTLLPPLSAEEGVVLLQHLGLGAIPVEYLRAAVAAVGGVPLCLEWVASLVQEPMLTDEWDVVLDQREGKGTDELEQVEMLTHRLQRLLEDSSLFGGPIAIKLKPLLKRVIEQRLSVEARAALCILAVASLPLGKPALQVLCARPAPLKEMRDSSLLVAYPHRVQLLPMVASTVLHQFSSGQVQTAEEQLIRAYTHWLDEGSAMSEREKGMIFTELVCLLLHHHRLLAAAELVLYHGWLSCHAGQILRLTRLVQDVLHEFDWRASPETECGGLLLHYYLASYLGVSIDERERAEAFERIRAYVAARQVVVESLMEVHLVDHIMRYHLTGDRFEVAELLLEDCFRHFEQQLDGDAELHATLLSKRAVLYSRWSGYTTAHGQVEEARRLREQVIALYERCLQLLEEALRGVPEGALRHSTLKKKQATFLNNLAYQLNTVGRFEEARKAVNRCIELKEQGYAERDSLAATYGEKSQILAALGQFQEALQLDEQAREEIRRCADVGDTMSQEEQWVYQVNQGRLYLLLGRVDEAERLLQEAEPLIHPRRRIFQVMAQDALTEIKRGREASAPASFQLDWRWVKRYRELSAYDAYWWWAHAGPFTEEEQQEWDLLFSPPVDEATKERLRGLLMQSRDRELAAALTEGREPHLRYPAIEIGAVRQRIADFLDLDAEINGDEPNAIVRRLYHGAIEDEVCFLRMIEATYERDRERFWALTQQLNPLPTHEEMRSALERVKQVVQQGMLRKDTVEISRRVIQALERFGLSLDLPNGTEAVGDWQENHTGTPPQTPHMVSAQAVRRFFEAVLRENGYEGWQVILDPNAHDPRVESGLRQLFLQDSPFSLVEIREYFSHEFLGHVARSVAGEYSRLGLLGMGTKGYMPTEEGLADYHERRVAALHGQAFDDSASWLGALAVGLASGVVALPQTFSSLFSFFEPFLLVYRLLLRNDEDRPTAEQRARKNASIRCLRAYRGVPDLERAGICNTKDVVYLRGYLEIEHAVAEDETVLDRLAVGKVALELLPLLQELGIVAPRQSLRELAYNPELDEYIRSFEDGHSL